MIVYMRSFQDLLNLHQPINAVHEVFATEGLEAYQNAEGHVDYVGNPILFQAGYVYQGVTYVFEKKYGDYYKTDKFYLDENAAGVSIRARNQFGNETVSAKMIIEKATELTAGLNIELEWERAEILSTLEALKDKRVIRVKKLII